MQKRGEGGGLKERARFTHRAEEELAHAQRDRDLLRVLVRVEFLSGHGLLALVDLEPEQDAAQPAAQRVQLEADWRRLPDHYHQLRHAAPVPTHRRIV
eukprot:4626690-Pleurochrysis_carterae.AAC.3